MKKNFFKKLSFILALAMIVTALAPASGVFAAAKAPKLSATSKTLHLDDPDRGANKYDFNISNKQSGWKYLWTSSDQDVVKVNKSNGLATATGAGTAKVSVKISDKSGEEVDTLSATVLVRDNIAKLTITNTPAGDKLAVGAENDFNRSYVTAAGLTKGSEGITRWTAADKDGKTDGATISDSGLFVASKAGEYTITARSFQSKSKYNEWLADNTKSTLVTASTTYTVKVAVSMTKVEQVDLDTFKVTFDSAVTDAATKLSVVYLSGAAKINAPIKTVTMSEDNKVATVDMYVKFVESATHVVSYPDMESVQFVAATSNLADVTRVAVLTTTAQKAIKKTVDIGIYNQAGVNIADTELLSRVTLTSSNNLATIVDGTKDLYMYNVGDTTTVTATFHTYNYDTNGQEIGLLTATGVITCVEQSTANAGTINAYTVAAAAGAFQNVKHTIAKGDTGLKLWVQTKGTDANGNVTYFDNTAGGSIWKYVSSNDNVVIIGADGSVWAANEGTATIVVSYNDKQVGSVDITVTASRKAASITLDANNITLSNADLDASASVTHDTKTVGLSVKDQLGGTNLTYTVSVVPNIASAAASALIAGNNFNTVNLASISFDAYGVAPGTYYYTVTATDSNNNKVPTYIIVDVKAPSGSLAYYQLEADKTSYDMKISSGDLTEVVTLSLYGYAANGVRLTKENINSTTLTVKDANGATVVPVPSSNDATIQLVSTTTSGSMLIANTKAVGNWIVTAVSGTPINAINFEVKNSQTAPTVSFVKAYTTQSNLLAAINDCYNFTLNGVDVNVADISDVNILYANGKQAQIKEVYLYEQISGNTYVKHTVKIDAIINYAQ